MPTQVRLMVTLLFLVAPTLELRGVTQTGEQASGIIDEIAGPWVSAQSRRPLARGDVLQRLDTVMLAQPADATLVVLMLESGHVWKKRCTASSPCVGTFQPISREEPAGFWAFVSRYWTSDRTLSPVFARARGAGQKGLVHGLAPEHSNRTDLTPIFQHVESGRYRAALVPAPDVPSNTAGRYDIPVTVVAGQPVLADPLTPGLYSATLTDDRGQVIGSTAVVLVSAGSRDAETGWQTANDKAQRLGLTPATLETLRARILYALHETNHAR